MVCYEILDFYARNWRVAYSSKIISFSNSYCEGDLGYRVLLTVHSQKILGPFNNHMMNHIFFSQHCYIEFYVGKN